MKSTQTHGARDMRILMAIAMFAAMSCFAQAPVDTGRLSGDQLQRDQYKAGAAYREMQRAEQAARDAQAGARQADAAYKDLQKRSEEARRQAEESKKQLEAAKAKEAQARKAYDDAVNAVDRDAQPPKKQ
jgi:hypothetical protein